MRQVTNRIANAFASRQSLTVGNTRTDGNHVWLHGNMIVKRAEDGQVLVSNAGWYSNTTKERLSAFCDVYQKNFEWFIAGEKYEGGWVSARTGLPHVPLAERPVVVPLFTQEECPAQPTV